MNWDGARLRVLVVSIDSATLRAGQVAWQRAGQFRGALAQRGIELTTSGTFAPWIFSTAMLSSIPKPDCIISRPHGMLCILL